MSKQKETIISPIGQTKFKRLRKFKVSSMKPDDPIYSRGFVIGGKRLGASKPTSKKE